MTEMTKGRTNLAQLSIQGSYTAATAQDKGKDYSRNIGQQQIFGSRSTQNAFHGNKSTESIAEETPVFSEEPLTGETSLDTAFHVLKPDGRA